MLNVLLFFNLSTFSLLWTSRDRDESEKKTKKSIFLPDLHALYSLLFCVPEIISAEGE